MAMVWERFGREEETVLQRMNWSSVLWTVLLLHGGEKPEASKSEVS